MSLSSRPVDDGSGSSGDSIEARLRVLEDDREIRDLIVGYTQRLDCRDYKGYAALFARDGRWTGQTGDATGPAAIEAMLDKAFGATPAGFHNTHNFHLATNILIELSGDRASAESRVVYFIRGDDARPVPCLAGRYQDDFVREDGRWRFARRRVIGDIPTMDEAAPAKQKEEDR